MLKILLFVLLLCYPATWVFAQETAADSSDAYETRHYTLLELPQKLWNVLIYPLGQFTIYAEREELPKQVRNWFTNEDHTFGLFPYVQLGGRNRHGRGIQHLPHQSLRQEKGTGGLVRLRPLGEADRAGFLL